MSRLACLILAALVTRLMPAAPVEAASGGPPAPIHTYIDTGRLAPATLATTERGPPVAYDRHPSADPVGRWSHGASARPSGTATRADATYTAPVSPARAVNAKATMGRQVVVADGDLSPLGQVGAAENSDVR